jgi:hypothetical protein
LESKPSRLRPKHIVYGIVFCCLLGLLLTYGRWEYLTRRYGPELERVAVFEFEAAALPGTTIHRADDIAQIKVFSCGSDAAELLLKDRQGNKWLMELERTADGSSWTAYHHGGWQIALIYIAAGSKAQRPWYWY